MCKFLITFINIFNFFIVLIIFYCFWLIIYSFTVFLFVIYIGRTGNNACDNYSKVLDEVAKDKNIKPYYLNTDLINTEEEWEKFDNSNKIFNEEWFTPTTLIVEKGNIIDYKMESMDKGTLISFLSENGI